jgi:nitrate/TMAO reductase-like tetraheme cytochrome c subunit
MLRRCLQLLAVSTIGAMMLIGFATPGALTAASPTGQTAKETSCVSCHRAAGDEAAGLYLTSIHSRAGISCSRCHGGNAASTDKAEAHGGRFVGKPASAQSNSTCGSCHANELAQLKASRHFTQRGSSRVDCVGCHGAHSVGSPTRNFSFAYYCSGCHGLEYLPEHPRDFQKLLAAVDRQNDAINELIRSGKKPSDDLLKFRKQTRDLMGEIVHATNMQGGLERAPQILKLDDDFKREFDRAK